MELGGSQDGGREKLEQPRAQGYGGAHNDALGHPPAWVTSGVHGGVKKVVGGLLKGGQHQHTVLHLCDAKAGDAQHGTPVRHDVCQQLGVAEVHVDGVVHVRVNELLDDKAVGRGGGRGGGGG